MHRILERQIKRYLGENVAISSDWKALFESISKTYADFDEDRTLLDRSLDLSSKEFLENSRHLKNIQKENERSAIERIESLEKYQTLVDNLSVGVYRNTPGPQGFFLEANPMIVSMFEAGSKEEFMKHKVSDLYQDPTKRDLFTEKIMKRGFIKNEEIYLHTLKGKELIASVSAVMKKDKDGSIYFDGIIEDITDRKKTEEALKNAYDKLEERVEERTKELGERVKELEDVRKAMTSILLGIEEEQKTLTEAKARDEAILANIGDGLVVTSTNQRIMFVNLLGEQILGWEKWELLGKDWFDIVKPKDEKFQEISSDNFFLQKVSSPIVDYYFVKKDGSLLPVSVTASEVFVERKSIGSVIVFRDVTKEMAIDQAKSKFVLLASHQLRTPLTGIEWTIERFLKKEKLTIEGKKYLDDIHFSAKRLSVLVKLLLNVSRIESGSISTVPESVDLVSLIDDCVNEHQILCAKGSISCTFQKHPEKLVVTVDRNLIEYIVQNLISNAIAYTLAGGKVEILLEEKEHSVLITAKDSGIGILKKDGEHIFEKFFRAFDAIKIKPDGTGLGLYIVRESAGLLGGRIWFESEEGKGSAFFVEIPQVSPVVIGKKGLILETEQSILEG